VGTGPFSTGSARKALVAVVGGGGVDSNASRLNTSSGVKTIRFAIKAIPRETRPRPMTGQEPGLGVVALYLMRLLVLCPAGR